MSLKLRESVKGGQLTFYHSPLPEDEAQRRAAAVRGVELGAVGFEGAAVVHFDLVALFALRCAACGLGDFDVEGFVEGGGEREEREEDGGEEPHIGMN